MSVRCAPNHLTDKRLNFALGIVWDRKLCVKMPAQGRGLSKVDVVGAICEQASGLGPRVS
jgi:hypothetical protein